jgi:predicted CopG family antitoxin
MASFSLVSFSFFGGSPEDGLKYKYMHVRLHMSTKTITITEEAYNRLKSRKGENQSFSDVIIQNFPAKKKLSEILDEIGQDDALADRIEAASIEMRQSKMREVDI